MDRKEDDVIVEQEIDCTDDSKVYLKNDWSHLVELGYTKEELVEIDRRVSEEYPLRYLVEAEYVANVRENTRYMLRYFEKPMVLRLLAKYDVAFWEDYERFATLMEEMEDVLGDDWLRIVQSDLEKVRGRKEPEDLMSHFEHSDSVTPISMIRSFFTSYREHIKVIEMETTESRLRFAIHKKGFAELISASVDSVSFTLPNEVTDEEGTVYPVKEIGLMAFCEQRMKYLILPEGIEWIGSSAFWGCFALMTVVFPASLRMMYEPFVNCWQYTENEGGEIQFRGSREQWEEVCNRSFSDLFRSLDRTPYNKVVRFVGDGQEFWIPGLDFQKYCSDQWSEEEDSARLRLCNLRGVVEVPETYTDEHGTVYAVTEIGPNAFAYNKEVTTVIIPASIQRIHGAAFYKCENLEKIVLLQGESTLQMDEYVFTECKSLKSVECGRPMQAHSTTMEVLQGPNVVWYNSCCKT